MNSNEYFSTSDFCLATALLAEGFPLIKLNKSNPRRVVFIFAPEQAIEEVVTAFNTKSLRIIPQTFYYAQRELKTLMYQEDSYAS